jgi:hypothetical protein
MALRMTSLNRMRTSEFVARKAIPVDVREAYARLYNKGWEERVALPANTPTHEAKKLHGEWLAEIETRSARCALLRKGRASPSRGSMRLPCLAAGSLASMRTIRVHPSDGARWVTISFGRCSTRRLPRTTTRTPGPIRTGEWAKEPQVREAVKPQIAEVAAWQPSSPAKVAR